MFHQKNNLNRIFMALFAWGFMAASPMLTVAFGAPAAAITASSSTIYVGESFTVTSGGSSTVNLASVWWFVEDVNNQTFHTIPGSVDGEITNLTAGQDFGAGSGTINFTQDYVVSFDEPGSYEIKANARDSLYPENGVAHQASEGSGIPVFPITVVMSQAPDAISDLSVASTDNQQVTLSWSAPQGNGAQITEYEIQYGTVASGLFDLIFTDDALPNATVSGLTNGEEYQFRVVAKNSVGTSGFSNIVTATPNIPDIDVVWTDVVGATVDGNSLTKTAINGWNAGAASTASFTGNGGAKFTASETNTHRVFGLSTENASASFYDIDYGIYLHDNGNVYVYENGTIGGPFSTFEFDDILSVERVGTEIQYKKNDILINTSAIPIANDQSLLVDVSLNTSGSTITDARFFGVTIGAPDAIDDLGAESIDQAVTLFWSEPSSNGSAITEYEVQYDTLASGTFNSILSAGTSLEVVVPGLTNGEEYQFRVVAKNAEGTSDSSNVVTAIPAFTMEANVVWTDLVGVVANRNSLTKTDNSAWGNGGAASTASFTGNGGAQFTVTEANTHRMFGLSTVNANANYWSIKYAIYLMDDGNVHVFENGTDRGLVSTCQSGDIFAVKREGTTIYYQKNGVTFYTSTVPTANDKSLLVDVALSTKTSTITNAQFVIIPSKVTNLFAEAHNTQVSLSWDTDIYAAGYKVKYGTAPGVYGTTIDVGDIGTYDVGALTNGVEYYFVVSAYNIHGESLNSDEVSAVPGAVVQYFYDNRNRLESVIEENVNIEYQYDGVGNINNKAVY